MIICKECGFENRVGTMYCEECGRTLADVTVMVAKPIIPQPVLDTMIPPAPLPEPPPAPVETEPIVRPSWGTAQLSQKSLVLIHFQDTARTLEIKPAKKLVIGRFDHTSPTNPDIDLAPYGALEKGVSRQHAALELKEETLVLTDLGSSNGTFLNGQRLGANQSRVLRDGDEIKFGKIVAYVHFT
jgi:hypothetical protein